MQNGWVWFFAQSLSFTFSIMSFYYATKKNPNFYLAFLFLAFAIGCRPFQMIYGLVILYFAQKHNKNYKNILLYILPAFMVGLAYAGYNYVRFENILEFGHNYLKEMTTSEDGQFSLTYVVGHLKSIFLVPPMGINGVMQYPKSNGFLIFPFISIVLLSISLHILLICMHITMGGWHFGNRYFIDTLPAFFLLFTILDSKILYYRIFYIPFFLYGLTFNVIGTTLFYMK